jgi:hypothetical protein
VILLIQREWHRTIIATDVSWIPKQRIALGSFRTSPVIARPDQN